VHLLVSELRTSLEFYVPVDDQIGSKHVATVKYSVIYSSFVIKPSVLEIVAHCDNAVQKIIGRVSTVWLNKLL
jgi:hypothetical protein